MKIANQIQFIIQIPYGLNVDFKGILRGDLKSIIDIDGSIKIYLNNKLFFSEEFFAILELILAISKWNKEGQNNDFIFNSIETDDSPLIQFTKNKSGWTIKSVWELFSCDCIFSFEQLNMAVKQLHEDFKVQMLEKYSLEINI